MPHHTEIARGRDLVDAASQPTEVRPTMRMMPRRVLAATTHDVGPHGPLVQMRQHPHDLDGPERPVLAITDALRRRQDLRMNRLDPAHAAFGHGCTS